MPEKLSDDFHPAPTWLTAEYMQDKLQIRYKDESIRVIHMDVQPATAKGENYASIITRVKVIYKMHSAQDQHTESFIVKTTFEGNSATACIMNSYGIYEREMEIYEKILPKLSELLLKTGDCDKLFADTLYVDHDHSAIIFEDLVVSHFTMADRIARLDMDHIHIVLRKLAKMHATAAVLHERMPGVFAQNYDRGIFNRHTDNFKPMITGMLAALTRYVAQSEDLKAKYHKKLVALGARIMEYGARVFDAVPDHFYTLAHGDFWTNNMMFKYDAVTKAPLDVIPIDFQFSAWASPAVDLHYFFNTSLREELRLHHQAELVQFYYNILAETLKVLEYKGRIPSLHDFCIQLEIRSFHALTSAFIFQSVMLCEETDDAEFSNLASDCERGIRFKDALFRNVNVQKNIERLLPIFDRKGLLDVMD